MCFVRFESKKSEEPGDLTEWYLAVSTVKELTYAPKKMVGAFIRIYRFISDKQIQLVHKTEVNDVVLAMAPFEDKLLVGAGKHLRLYDLGKRKLLRKCENKNFPTAIQSIKIMDDRIFVGDMCEAFFLVNFSKNDKTLTIVADSLAPRYLTASCVVDYDTMCGADKFGNFVISRLPPHVSEDIKKDPTGGRHKPKGRYGETLGRAPKFQDIAQYHVGEMITSICKTTLVPGGAEVLFYSTLMGGLGMFVPFTSREDVDFFTHLEMHLRQELPPLCGRDHLAYRSYYFPVKDCLDGDLCEQFRLLDYKRQQAIAEELVCTPAEVDKKLEEMQNKVL